MPPKKNPLTQVRGILDPEGNEPNPLTGEVYSEDYRKLAKFWSSLPGYAKRKEILGAIDSAQITFLISGTGSGKTVLLPKFALHWTGYEGVVGVTLPKRQVTSSSASFAAATLDVKLGEQVGYVHKNSPRDMLSENSKLIYMTDGILVKEFTQDPTLAKFRVIIIDEAHERKVQIDLLMLFIKLLLLSGKRPDLKVIIMSATIDPQKYHDYFAGISTKVVEVSGAPNYPIKVHFSNSDGEKDGTAEARQLLSRDDGDILLFSTSGAQAHTLCSKLRPNFPKMFCVELYAEAPERNKRLATHPTEYQEETGMTRKLVIATNLAESSLTVDGLTYVIDPGYEFSSSYEPTLFAQILKRAPITQAQAIQRRGRVGRTTPGECYHLYTQDHFNSLPMYPDPAILKEDITTSLLQTVKLTPEKTVYAARQLFTQLMDPPTTNYLRAAESLLWMYDLVDGDGKITKTGYIAGRFAAVELNRVMFLVKAYASHVAGEAAVIVACLEVTGANPENLLLRDLASGDNSKKVPGMVKFRKYGRKYHSDHLAFYHIYEEYRQAKDRDAWLKKTGFRKDIFRKINNKRRELFGKLHDLMQKPIEELSRTVNKEAKLVQCLKASHMHLTGDTNGQPVVATKKLKIKTDDHSVMQTKDIKGHRFIYDSLTWIGNEWKYGCITIV